MSVWFWCLVMVGCVVSWLWWVGCLVGTCRVNWVFCICSVGGCRFGVEVVLRCLFGVLFVVGCGCGGCC